MENLFKSFAEELEQRKLEKAISKTPNRSSTLGTPNASSIREASRMPRCGDGSNKMCDMENNDINSECQSCQATIGNISTELAFKDFNFELDPNNPSQEVPEHIIDREMEHFERLSKMPKDKVYAMHHKMFNRHMFDSPGFNPDEEKEHISSADIQDMIDEGKAKKQEKKNSKKRILN